MSDLNDLAGYIESLATDLPTIASTVARECADAIVIDLIENTPVDIGVAMSGWQVTLDAPATERRPAFAPSPKGKMIKGKWTHTVDPVTTFFGNVGEAEAAIEGILEAKQPGQDIYITNNEPYMQKLNDGSSTQQPAGFIDRAMIIAENIIAKAKVL